ncbi:MAG TPA: SGNH/GDSL hydrolase family protein [Jatrophihabitantaceae bacterium]|jgi:lysophospholipase L1-like esterase
MSRTRLLIAAVVAAFSVPLALASPAGAASSTHYVALGDSYASGLGSGSYGTSGDCYRSSLAFSQLWADAHSPAAFVSVACSGATSSDVANTQLSALSAGTTLVSVVVGGNDVNFAPTLEDCVIWGTDTCVSDINADENEARTVLPGRLDSLYSAIHADAPNARVVVVGYPRFYDLSVSFCIGLSETSRQKINEGADVLDGVIQAAAARHGFGFADVRGNFAAGHEICDGGSSWLHSVDWGDLGDSYHPTAGGQSGGYLPAFTALAGS